jgi:hypothetical protein
MGDIAGCNGDMKMLGDMGSEAIGVGSRRLRELVSGDQRCGGRTIFRQIRNSIYVWGWVKTYYSHIAGINFH